MLVVTDGTLVIEDRIYMAGEEIDGLASDVEKKLVAAGLAERAGDAASAADDNDPATISTTCSKADLQAICREYGLSERGNKAELIARIEAYEQAAAEELEAEIEAEELEDEQPPDLKAEVPR